jgi:hypothetical protein
MEQLLTEDYWSATAEDPFLPLLSGTDQNLESPEDLVPFCFMMSDVVEVEGQCLIIIVRCQSNMYQN